MAGISDVLGGVLGGSGEGGGSIGKLIAPVMEMIQNNGGLQALVARLQDSPIAGQVNSWLGSGQNEPVSGDQVAEAVGPENVEQIAQQSGMSTDEVKGGLSQLLPNLVDKFSPGGQIPGADQVQDLVKNIPGAEQVQGQLGSMLGGLFGKQ